MKDNIVDREERARLRRAKEARVHKVLAAGAALSLVTGTATIYAVNTGSDGESNSPSGGVALIQPSVGVAPTPTETQTTRGIVSLQRTTDRESDEDDDENEEEGSDEGERDRSSTSQYPTPTPNSGNAEIVIGQERSDTRSSSTPSR